MNKKNRYAILSILITYFISIIGSFILKKDLVYITSLIFIIIIISIGLLKNNVILFFSAMIFIMISNGISKYIGIFQYAPMYFYILMLIKLIFIRNKVIKDKILIVIISISIIISIIPLLVG
ncbi:hypothetical protein C4D30_14160, partial [Clostridium perfringens]